MGIRVIEGVEAGTETPYAVLFCSTTGEVLGKRISGATKEAERFLSWYERRGPASEPAADFRRISHNARIEWIERWQRAGCP
jgi:hypothetical protein